MIFTNHGKKKKQHIFQQIVSNVSKEAKVVSARKNFLLVGFEFFVSKTAADSAILVVVVVVVVVVVAAVRRSRCAPTHFASNSEGTNSTFPKSV